MTQYAHTRIVAFPLNYIASVFRASVIHRDDPANLRANASDYTKHMSCHAIARNYDSDAGN